jgi:two-component system, response regulator PdtaR
MVFETIAYPDSATGAKRVSSGSRLDDMVTGLGWTLVLVARTGEGSIVVPAANPPSSASSASSAPAGEAADTALRVVIAEDEALIRLDLREMLIDAGFDVVGEAADGEQVVALANELHPDVVICDIKMPKMDGIAAAAQIAGNRVAPVVMLTAFSQRDLIERARDAGAMAYLVKPFEKRDLLPAIEMATSRFAEIKALEEEVSDLRDRLEARKLIERAKGALMTSHKMSEPEAFRWIQRAAMDNRTSMRAVAELVLSGDDGGVSGAAQ